MNRAFLMGIVVFFAVVGVSLLGGTQKAIAGHGCHGCYGYSGCYGCAGCDGCYGCWGPVVHHPVRFRHHHRWHGCHGCYGYYGCHGCTGYYRCGGCYGCAGGVIVEQGAAKPSLDAPPAVPEEPKAEAAPKEEEAKPAAKEPAAEAAPEKSAQLNVRVPADATVVINDYVTKSTGVDRKYISRGLQAGASYRFEVRAEVTRNGERISEAKVVQLTPNQTAELRFNFDTPQVARLANR